MNNRAIILAAGRGSRLGHLTDNSHKCLTVLNNKTLLDWQIQSLTEAGLNEIILVGGYNNHLLNGNFTKVINERWHSTNMVASLFCNKESEADTIVSYSDIVYKPEHVKDLINSEGDICIAADLDWFNLWSLRFEKPLDDAETFRYEGNILLEIGGKTDNSNDIQAQYMGLLKITKKGWIQMTNIYNSLTDEAKDKLDMTSLISLLLKSDVKINITLISGGWCEVDNISDLHAYENKIKSNEVWAHKWY